MNLPLYKKLFFAGGLWNIAIGVFGLLFHSLTTKLMFGEQALNGNFHQVLFFKIFSLVVLLFGIGYCCVARDLNQNRVVVWLGIIAKLILFAIFVYCFFVGRATFLALLTLFGDFIWALIFFRFLQLTKNNVKINNFIG